MNNYNSSTAVNYCLNLSKAIIYFCSGINKTTVLDETVVWFPEYSNCGLTIRGTGRGQIILAQELCGRSPPRPLGEFFVSQISLRGRNSQRP
jgi:hypothetical protein